MKSRAIYSGNGRAMHGGYVPHQSFQPEVNQEDEFLKGLSGAAIGSGAVFLLVLALRLFRLPPLWSIASGRAVYPLFAIASLLLTKKLKERWVRSAEAYEEGLRFGP